MGRNRCTCYSEFAVRQSIYNNNNNNNDYLLPKTKQNAKYKIKREIFGRRLRVRSSLLTVLANSASIIVMLARLFCFVCCSITINNYICINFVFFVKFTSNMSNEMSALSLARACPTLNHATLPKLPNVKIRPSSYRMPYVHRLALHACLSP